MVQMKEKPLKILRIGKETLSPLQKKSMKRIFMCSFQANMNLMSIE